MKLKFKHLIGIVAVAGAFAIIFGTLGVLVMTEIENRRYWRYVTDDLLRGIPAYLGERP